MARKGRFVRPETVRLDLSDGDWIEVKRTLSIGERRKVYARSARYEGGHVVPDFEMVDKALVLQYLVDWSFVDDQDKRVPVTSDALDNLTPESWREIDAAIKAHEEAQAAARPTTGETSPEATSPSAG